MIPSAPSRSHPAATLRHPLTYVMLALWSVALVPPGAEAQGGPAKHNPPEKRPDDQGSYIARLDVVAVKLLVRLPKHEDSGSKSQMAASDLVVFENDQERRVLDLQVLSELSKEAPQNSAPGPAATVAYSPVRFAFYVDVPFASHRALQSTYIALERWLDDIAALGTIELIVANPRPVERLSATRDARAVRKVMRDLRNESSARSEVERVRSGVLRGGVPDSRRQVLRYLAAEESRFLRERAIHLAQWAAQDVHRGEVRILFLISGAFDADPADFYLARLAPDPDDLSDRARLAADLAELRQTRLYGSLARDLGALGWAVFPIVSSEVGFSSIGSAAENGHSRWLAFARGASPSLNMSPFMFTDPLGAWQEMARVTGGTVLSSARLVADSLRNLGGLAVLTYERTGEPVGRAFSVEVRSRVTGKRLPASLWRAEGTPEELAALRGIQQLATNDSIGELKLNARMLDSQPAADGSRTITVAGSISAPSGTFGEIGTRRPTLRLTVVPEAVGGQPKAQHRIVESFGVGSTGATFTAMIHVVAKVERVALVAEDLASGMWGGALVQLLEPPPGKP